MRLINNAGGVMYATGEVAEFYLGRGWRNANAAPVVDAGKAVKPAPVAGDGEAVKAAPRRTTRRRKADNGVDATE